MAKVDKDNKFGTDIGLKQLEKGAKVCCKEVLGLKEGETVLIITNPVKDVRAISMAIFDAALACGAKPTIVFQPVKTQLDFAEDTVINALKAEPDVVLSISHEKLGKDREAMKKPYKYKKNKLNHIFHYLLEAKKTRSFWSPSITVSMFKRTAPINYELLSKRCAALKKILDRAEEIKITTKIGTDLTIGVRGRKAKNDDGDFTKPGAGGNIPCGEVFISPELGASHGTLMFDGSISSTKGVIIIKKPIVCDIKNGFVKKISGGTEAKKLEQAVKSGVLQAREMEKSKAINKKDSKEYQKNAYNLGELGIGLNEKATIIGNMLEDEKVLKTCHIAIGANYDRDAEALIHLDGLMKKPTMTAVFKGGKTQVFMKDGELVLE